MDGDLISMKPGMDNFTNAVGSDIIEVSNHILKFQAGHPIFAKSCSKIVRKTNPTLMSIRE